ncbi:TonB-dependent receptor [Olivibacter sp. CPCC 100613]|uniref:SusC/RagA family TonB-linked outer membrane protein n=1 Tax=Olivibacter sp. CPCC 100613 TaxID=3079931 RepID=UPI002FFC231D
MILLIRTGPKSLIPFLLLLASTYYGLYAQQTKPLINSTLKGNVQDAQTGEAIAGATLTLEGTTHRATSDGNGRFNFVTGQRFPYTVIVSYVGYKTRTLIVNESEIAIQLEPNLNELEGVVVVGYGTQKKSTLTGAVATVDSKFLSNRPITNATQALQGANGVYVNQNKGRPGAEGNTIRIRGVGTLNNNNPLVLVDGIEYPLSEVNPNDIESVSILKDAASAAIYGNRAANGVILVKTKTGQKGQFQVDYNVYAGSQRATFKPNVVSNAVQYMEGKNRALANEGKPAEYEQQLLDEYRGGTDPFIYPNTNWFDVMYRNAPIQEHNLRLSGGGEKTSFSLSFGYLNQEGVLLATDAKKYTLNSNVQSDLSSWLKIGANVMGTFWNDRESAYTADEGNGEGGIMGLLYRGLPMQAPYAQDGSYADQWVRVPGHNFFRNPLALSYEGFRRNHRYRTLANVFAEFKLPLGLTYKITAAANIFFGKEKYAYPQISLTNPKTGAVTPMGNIPARGVQEIARDSVALTNFHTVNFVRQIGDHSVNALAGFSIERFDDGNFDAYNQGYLGNELNELDAGSTAPAVGGKSSQSRLQSYFGRINYSFRDKYIFEANVRYDGSSRFAKDKRWGLFPSFSGAWRLNKEPFLSEATWIDNFKLRASWGQLGNQNIPLYSYVNAISLGNNYSFNNNVVPGTAIVQIADPSISWETTTMTNIGLDFDVLQGKLALQLDVFDKTTSEILRQVNVPAQVGNLTGPFRNIGKVSNKGIELSLAYQNIIGDFRYRLSGNLAYLKNKVLDVKGNVYYDGATIIREGDPISAFYGLQSAGIFQNEAEIEQHAFQAANTRPGDIRYVDQNGDGIVDNNDRIVIGSSVPKYTYGFTLSGSYKNVDLDLFFQGVADVDTYANGNLAFPYRNGAGVTTEWLTDSWTPENPGARLPILTTSSGYPQNFLTSDFWIKDASYLRLKNIQLAYSLPNAWLEHLHIRRFKVFVNAQNYLTFTNFKLGDPERNLTRANMIDYPNYKSITAGINLTL